MGGFPKGTRLKADKDMHRCHFTVNLREDERDDFFGLCRDWEQPMSVCIRKCVKIVCQMPEDERNALWRKVSWN